MTKLGAAIDVSGRPNDDNYKFIAFVIYTVEFLNSVRKVLGVSSICNMAKTTTTRNKIAAVLNFDNNDSLAICCRIDRADTIGKYRIQKHKKKMETRRLYSNFNREIFFKIREEITDFIINHKCELDDVYFECDGDSRDFTKDVGIPHIDKGAVHSISDTIAWSYNNNRKLSGIIFKDLRKELQSAMT